MKNILFAGLLLITSSCINGMTKGEPIPTAPIQEVVQLVLDDNKEFTPQILTHYKVPQPLLDALKNSKNKNALRYLGLRLYNRRVASLNSEGKGDYLDFSALENMKNKVSMLPTEANIQNLTHWLSRSLIPTGTEILKKESYTGTSAGNGKNTHSLIHHSDTLGNFSEIICRHINHIAQNEDWTPNKTENVMINFLKIYLNIKNQNVSSI